MHQNIAGLLNKSDALMVNLEELSERKINVDVICISEHFMKKGQEGFLNINNYSLAACFCRYDSKRGGTCILVSNNCEFQEITEIRSISLTNVFECCAVNLIEYKIVVICIYRVPKQNNINIFF